MQQIQEGVFFYLSVYGIKVVAAIAIFIVGRWAAKLVEKTMEAVMGKRGVDPTLVSFIGNLSYVAILAFVVLAALNQLGIQTTSFVAVIGAAGLAVGLALQGSLSNFAAGFLMIIFKPFKVGDFIEGAGTAGVVEKIQIFTTQLHTPDNKTIIVPNSKLTADNIVNFSTKATRRVELVVGIGYDSDIDRAKQIVGEILDSDGRVLKDPAAQIAVSDLGESRVSIVVRPWVNSGDYWDVYFDSIETIKKRFDREGISIPYPQRDIHVFEHRMKNG